MGLEGMHSLRGVRVGGQRFALPFGYPPPIQEPWMSDVLGRLLNEFEGVFVDIGANLGQTLLQFRSLDRTSRYLGFEPNPHCAAYVMQLITLNKFEKTDLIPAACALGHSVEKLHFYQDSPFDAAASMVKDFRSNEVASRRCFIVAAPFDDCLAASGVEKAGIRKDRCRGLRGKCP